MKHTLHLAPVLLAAFFTLPALAQAAPPSGWTCTASWYGTDDGCDCGCGVMDSDCPSAGRDACEYNHCESGQVPGSDGASCAANSCGDGYRAGDELCDDGGGQGCTADCSAVDAGYSCGYGGDGCHALVCGDGTREGDETCDDANSAGGDGCSADCQIEEGFACRTPGEPCSAVPAGWNCSANYYGSGDGCDCGCGVEDADCDGGCAEPGCDVEGVCSFCYDAEGAMVGCASGGADDDGSNGEPGDDNGGGGGSGDDDSGDDEGNGGGGVGLGGSGGGDEPGDVEPSTDSGGCAATTPADVPAALAMFGLMGLLGRRRR